MMACEHKPDSTDPLKSRYAVIAGAPVVGPVKIHRCRLCGASYISAKPVLAAAKELAQEPK